MKTLRLQRGQLLAAGIILIAVVAVMILALGYQYVSGERGGSLNSQSERAYFAARSGLEYSATQYSKGNSCSSLNNFNAAVAGGAFTLTTTLYAPPTLTLTATTAALTAASSSIAVTSTTGYAPYGRALIDAELINYASTTATSFNGVTRGVGGTTAAAHASGATVSQNLCSVSSKGTSGAGARIVEAAIGSPSTASPGALGTMGADAMVVYGKGTALTGASADRNVYYRLWDGTVNNWGAEQAAQQVGSSSSPLYFVVQFARTRNEAIMGVLDGANRLYIQVWNGISWSYPKNSGGVTVGNPLTTAWNASVNSGVTNLARTFQIAYEYNSDQALIVYQDNTNSPKYVTWNGSALSASTAVSGSYPVGNGQSTNLCGGTNTASTRHLWFRMAPRNVAGSDDILMMSTDCNQDVYGMRWTGAAWSDMGITSRWDTSTSNSNNRNAIDVAWQANGALALFAYADANSNRINYRTWTAATSTLSGTANTTPSRPGGYSNMVFEWLRLYPDPSNNILVVAQSDTRSLVSTGFNSGGVPVGGTYVGHENAAVESATSRSFDFAWEKLPSASGNGWLLWGSSGSGGVRQRYFTSPSTWAGIGATVLDHALVVQQGVLSRSGRFVTDNYQAAASTNDDIISATTTGGGTAWPNVSTQLWAGPTTLQQGERVFVATREGTQINTGTSTGIVDILQSKEVIPP